MPVPGPTGPGGGVINSSSDKSTYVTPFGASSCLGDPATFAALEPPDLAAPSPAGLLLAALNASRTSGTATRGAVAESGDCERGDGGRALYSNGAAVATDGIGEHTLLANGAIVVAGGLDFSFGSGGA